MADIASNGKQGASAGKSAVERLLAAIEYPDWMPDAYGPVTLRVDGMEIFAEESNGRIVLSRRLTADDSLLRTLAGYAIGRMLHEDALLAYGAPFHSAAETPAGSAFLWQDAPANASERDMLLLFESFMNSCDWWRARVDALAGKPENGDSAPETMVIRP